METVETATEKTWDDDLMRGRITPNGGVVMTDVMKNQETTSEMAVIYLYVFFTSCFRFSKQLFCLSFC